ncbi:MAG: ABC transporter ATP-binding protein [Acidimicrobiales bacterium]
MADVTFEAVSKHFGDVVAVDDLTLAAGDDDFLVLLGPSGCGKSTALRMLAGLETPTAGTIRIGGEVVNHIEPKQRDVSMVFQSYALYPHKSVFANIAFPLRARGASKDEQRVQVESAATMLGLDELLDRRPGQLSGGQRQRVALARAIVRHPQVFLMDEPLSNLDAKMRTQTRAELVELHQRLRTTFIYVTHDQVEAMTMGTKVAVMESGRLQQLGPPQEVYERPANVFVARFIGSPPMNTLGGAIIDRDGRRSLVLPSFEIALPDELARQLEVGDHAEVIVGVRPEHLRIADEGLPAKLRVVESLGHERHLVCESGDGEMLIARVPADAALPAEGTTVHLATTVEALHLFDAATGDRIIS